MFEECLYFNSNALARAVTRIWTEAYKPFGLSPPHAFLLRVVLARPGLMPRELALELALSRSTVTRFLDSLEKRGFIAREMTAVDGREVHVFPTETAKGLHCELDATGKKLSQRMADIIGWEDLSLTVSNLRQMREFIEG
ncbi:MarR family transcriptional regulator [uncultured Desulfuromusa sp.]|uniref:MarR family winged helix-turn-helix transcriptional regulator n=1 Tax=uncultured Desulfuromusa sp. TaxID=219183 RepID=UPI002AA6E9C5|nr:MarR family transcriptional regulator [uncultured Desulfuromusa sp.]